MKYSKTKREILALIRKHCRNCPLRCDESCPLYEVKDGIDKTKTKMQMTEQREKNLKRRWGDRMVNRNKQETSTSD